jgi:hypothetical protein
MCYYILNLIIIKLDIEEIESITVILRFMIIVESAMNINWFNIYIYIN